MRILLFAAALAAPVPAFAHAQLTSAAPAVGGTVQTAPSQVEIGFSEAVEPRFSTIAVTDPAGRRVDRGEPKTLADARHLAIAVGPLAPGVYHVVWHATSVDTHKTEGAFEFTVER